LAAQDMPVPTVVNVPEWGGDVYVRTMYGTERDAWEFAILGQDGKVSPENFRAHLLVRTLADEQGNRLFADADAAALSAKAGPTLARLYDISRTLNKL